MDGHRRRWLGLLVAVVAVALASMTYVHLSHSVSLPTQGASAERYFRALGAPPGGGPLRDFRTHNQDGMQNEDASGSYTMTLSRGAVLSHYRAACQRLGLRSPPSAETLRYAPEALCDGAATVTVTPTCTNGGCDVFVAVIGG